MIDNFKTIEKILNFSNKNDFYIIQIMKRRKDNPAMKKGVKILKEFYIFSFDDLNSLREEIITLCDANNARAYINPSKRNLESVVGYCMEHIVQQIVKKQLSVNYWLLLSSLSQHIFQRNFKQIQEILMEISDGKLFYKVVGQNKCSMDRIWVVDVDTKDLDILGSIQKKIKNLQKKINKKSYDIVATLPTKNGFHIISQPFNKKEFMNEFSDVDIHSNSPTILYIS